MTPMTNKKHQLKNKIQLKRQNQPPTNTYTKRRKTMKIKVIYSVVVLIILLINLPASGANIEPVTLSGNQVIMSVSHSATTVTIVRYVKELRYCERNTTLGTIFWKRERLDFPEPGQYSLPMDLSKADYGKLYCVVIVIHDTGKKYKFKCRILNGQFTDVSLL